MRNQTQTHIQRTDGSNLEHEVVGETCEQWSSALNKARVDDCRSDSSGCSELDAICFGPKSRSIIKQQQAVTAADLKPLHPGNSLVKSADDTYLVVPSVNAGTRQQERDKIATWAAANNLKLNVRKSKENVFQNFRRRTAVTPPQPLPDISRENVLKILGVTHHKPPVSVRTIINIHRVISVTARNRCTRFASASAVWIGHSERSSCRG